MPKNKSLHPRKFLKTKSFSFLAPRHVLRSAKLCFKRGIMILNKLTRQLGLQRMILEFSPFLEPAHDHENTSPIERTQNLVPR